MVIPAMKTALENMDKNYCKLSQIDYASIGVSKSVRKRLAEEKYLERPFAYEFYHRLRELMDSDDVNFGGPIIQAEVDKRYQHCFKTGKIPDFIIHVPNARRNLAVIEFKLATNLSKLEHDFKKLVEFKKNEDLKYPHVIEVIIGNGSSLIRAKDRIMKLNKSEGEKITIIEFNTDSWKVTDWEIMYFDVHKVA
jgi:hypothetical protein